MRVRVDLRVVLALIVVLALFVRVVPLTYSHFWDETVFLQDAKFIVDGRTNYDEFFESGSPRALFICPRVYLIASR